MIADALSNYPDADDVLSCVLDALAVLWVADFESIVRASGMGSAAVRNALKVAIDLGCVSTNAVHGLTVYSLAD